MFSIKFLVYNINSVTINSDTTFKNLRQSKIL